MIYEFSGGPRDGEHIEGPLKAPIFLFPEVEGVRLIDAYLIAGWKSGARGRIRVLLHVLRAVAARQPPLSPEPV